MQSNRLEFRLVKPSDAAFFFQLMNSSGWIQFIGDRGIRNSKDALQYIADKMHADLKVKGFVNHVMIEKVSGLLVGTCSLHDRIGVPGMDVGYALLPEFEGKGYATEGAQFMVDLAFNQYKQTRMSAITVDENKGSCKVIENLGFVHQGYVTLPAVIGPIKWYTLDK